MRRCRAIATVLCVTGLLWSFGDPAGAGVPERTGWWWAPQQDAVAGVRVPPPPWVEPDGLYVAANATGTEAVSAVAAPAEPGATFAALELEVTYVQGAPVVGLCPALGDWEGASGERLDRAPAFDCTRGAILGELAEDGRSIRFDLSALPAAVGLNVALVPGLDEAGAGTTFQLATAPPGPAAIVTEPAPAPSPPPELAAPDPDPASPDAAPSLPAEPAGSTPGAVAFGPRPSRSVSPDPFTPAPSTLGSSLDVPAVDPLPDPLDAAAVPVVAQQPVDVPEGADRIRLLSLAGLGLVAATGVWDARRTRPPASLLVPIPVVSAT